MNNEEQSYEAGRRQALLLLLTFCMKQLGYEDLDTKRQAALVRERVEAIITLRSLCDEFGDNDWEDDLYLADIIEKHLGKHLWKHLWKKKGKV